MSGRPPFLTLTSSGGLASLEILTPVPAVTCAKMLWDPERGYLCPSARQHSLVVKWENLSPRPVLMSEALPSC